MDDLVDFQAGSLTFLAGYGIGDPRGANPAVSPTRLILFGDIIDQSPTSVGLGVSYLTLADTATIQVDAATFYFLRADSKLDGVSNLSKTGAGTLGFTPSDTSDFRGPFEVASGRLAILSDTRITNPLTVDQGALLEVFPSHTFSFTDFQGAGSIVVDPRATLSYVGTDSPTFSSEISGPGSFVMAGSGTATLAPSFGVTGPIVVDSGTLQLGSFFDQSALNLPNDFTIHSNATLQVANASTTIGTLAGVGQLDLNLNRDLTLGSSRSAEFDGTITGFGNLVLQGPERSRCLP